MLSAKIYWGNQFALAQKPYVMITYDISGPRFPYNGNILLVVTFSSGTPHMCYKIALKVIT